MLTAITSRMTEEKGFTLIEVLVVLVIIGVLAAIALPVFLGQRQKGHDSGAKSNARNMVSQVESCYTQRQSYGSCDSPGELDTTGLTVLPARPAVGSVGDGVFVDTNVAGAHYQVVAQSLSGNQFYVTKLTGGTTTRSCDSSGSSLGGCDGASW
jgi:type IV pilus assembly protein PilA